MEIQEYKQWIDENDIALTINKYQDALEIDLYWSSEEQEIEDKGMQFTFKHKSDLEAFVKYLNEAKEYVWP